MRPVFKYGIIFLGVTFLAGTATYMISPYVFNKRETPQTNVFIDDDPPPYVPTNKDLFVDGLTSMGNIDARANILIESEQLKHNVSISFDGTICLEDFESIEAQGLLNVSMGTLDLDIYFTYLNNTIFVEIEDSYYKMKTSSFNELGDIIKPYIPDLTLPEQFQNISTDDLLTSFGQMEENDSFIGDGHKFDVNILGANLMFYCDDEFKFTGLALNDYNIEGFLIDLTASIDVLGFDNKHIVDPTINEDGEPIIYTDFANSFGLLRTLSKLTNKRQFLVGFNAFLDGSENQIIGGDFNIDLINNKYEAKTRISYNNISRSLNALYKESNLFFEYNNILKGVMTNQGINSVMEILKEKLGTNDLFNYTIDSLTEITSDTLIYQLMNENYENVTELLSALECKENETIVSIKGSWLGLDAECIEISINHPNETLNSITINGIEYKNHSLSLSLQLENEYIPILEINEEEYDVYDPVSGLVGGIESLIAQKQFGLNFEVALSNAQTSTKTIDAAGQMQFDLEKGDGSGQVTLTDNKNTNHLIEVDVKDNDNMYFKYNSQMKGYFQLQTIRDLTDVISTLIRDKDKVTMELFGEMIEVINASSLMQIINGDINPLFDDLIKNISISENEIIVQIDNKLIGYTSSAPITIKIQYHESNLLGVTFENVFFDDMLLDFSIQLVEYNSEKVRFDYNDTYMDFSDIKTLVLMGIKTSQLEYFHIGGQLSVTILGYDIVIPVDLYIHNNNGKIELNGRVEIPTGGLLWAFNSYHTQSTFMKGIGLIVPMTCDTQNRVVDIMYKDGMVYLHRSEQWQYYGWNDYEQYTKVTLDTFMDDIVFYLANFTLGLESQYVNQIVSSSTGERETPMKYENILQSFDYTPETKTFSVSLNMNEIANNSDFSACNVTVVGNDDGYLSSVSAHLEISVGITISIDINLRLLDIGANFQNKIDEMNTYIFNHESDNIGQIYTFGFGAEDQTKN